MSQILRALNRVRRPRGDFGGASSGRDDDAVLAGLGVRNQNASPKGLRHPRPVILWVLLGVVLLAAGATVAVNMWRTQAAAIEPSLNVAARNTEPPRVAGQQPSPPPTTPGPAGGADTSPPAPEPEAEDPPPAAVPRTRAAERDTPVTASNPPRSPAAAETPPPAQPPAPAPIAATTAAPPAPISDDFELAVYYQQTGDFEKAVAHYQAVLQRDPLNVAAHNNLGLLYKEKGRLVDDAIAQFQKALYIDPTNALARNNLGVTLLEHGRPEAAASHLRAIVDAQPESVDARVNLALALSKLKQPGAAQEMLMSALGLDPKHAAAHYNLGLLYEEEGEVGKALDHYRAFLKYAGPEHSAIAEEVTRRIATLEKKSAG
ncbi:MAG: tetratricopeptide repeat protein [Vicinamibacterales bacterium]